MFLMNRQLRITKILLTVLLVVSLSLLVGCHQQQQESSGRNISQPESQPGFLTITGDGVEHQIRFKLTELKEMDEAQASQCYSTVNNWPAKKFVVGNGVKVSYLLDKAGIKDDAQTIIIWAADGYNAIFTREQLEEKRYSFPNLLEGNEEGAQEVPAILAWEYREGTNDLSKATSGKLCLLLGQKGLNDVVAAACVKDVATLEVLTEPPGQWSEVQARPASGKVKQGTKVVLEHPEQDLVKIYYTTDGSDPDEKSCVYNPSADHFQPEMNQPIIVDESMTIKAVVIGFGKNNSQTAVFAYEVE